MKKLLSVLLAAVMFLLPAAGLAESQEITAVDEEQVKDILTDFQVRILKRLFPIRQIYLFFVRIRRCS